MPLRTTPVPAPSGGSVEQTVAPTPWETAPPVDLISTSEIADQVTVSLESIESTTAEAGGPGEMAGPALVVHVVVDNGSDATVDLTTSYVSLLDSTGAPGFLLTSDPYRPLTGQLQPGGTADGYYVFRIDEAKASPVTVLVNYTAGASVAQFEGDPK